LTDGNDCATLLTDLFLTRCCPTAVAQRAGLNAPQYLNDVPRPTTLPLAREQTEIVAKWLARLDNRKRSWRIGPGPSFPILPRREWSA